MGLLGPGKFLREMHEHEKSIEGTIEELRYYSHDANEYVEHPIGIPVFTVGEDRSESHCDRHLVKIYYYPKSSPHCNKYFITRKSPVTINTLSAIALDLGWERYVVKDLEGKIISFDSYREDIYIESLEDAQRNFKPDPLLNMSKDELVEKVRHILRSSKTDEKLRKSLKELVGD